ncbi:MAG: DUF192 domain-containing protein [Candidatus Buchananbacteria bacterium]
MSSGKKISLIVVVFLIALVIFFAPKLFSRFLDKSPRAIIDGKEIRLEIVKTTEQMQRGLSFRDSLDASSGMLFVYDKYVVPSFWMKDMRFSIDIIWIRDNSVIGIEENLPVITSGTLPLYKPSELVNYVLEVNAGLIKQNGISPGDKVSFKNL